MPGVDLLDINSPAKTGTRRPLPLERRSNVLAREAEAEAHAALKEPEPEADADAEPVASGSTPPSVNRNSGNVGKRRRPESPPRWRIVVRRHRDGRWGPGERRVGRCSYRYGDGTAAVCGQARKAQSGAGQGAAAA
jgi:hypothetical protein